MLLERRPDDGPKRSTRRRLETINANTSARGFTLPVGTRHQVARHQPRRLSQHSAPRARSKIRLRRLDDGRAPGCRRLPRSPSTTATDPGDGPDQTRRPCRRPRRSGRPRRRTRKALGARADTHWHTDSEDLPKPNHHPPAPPLYISSLLKHMIRGGWCATRRLRLGACARGCDLVRYVSAARTSPRPPHGLEPVAVRFQVSKLPDITGGHGNLR